MRQDGFTITLKSFRRARGRRAGLSFTQAPRSAVTRPRPYGVPSWTDEAFRQALDGAVGAPPPARCPAAAGGRPLSAQSGGLLEGESRARWPRGDHEHGVGVDAGGFRRAARVTCSITGDRGVVDGAAGGVPRRRDGLVVRETTSPGVPLTRLVSTARRTARSRFCLPDIARSSVASRRGPGLAGRLSRRRRKSQPDACCDRVQRTTLRFSEP